jgi:hypothetical protein
VLAVATVDFHYRVGRVAGACFKIRQAPPAVGSDRGTGGINFPARRTGVA